MTLADEVLSLPRPLLLALDVDGTLAPIREDPDAAAVPPETLALLEQLAGAPEVTVALVTGRDAASLGRLVPLGGLWRAVEHGRVVLGPEDEPAPLTLPARAERALASFVEFAEAELVPRGARLETKPSSRAIHVRGLAESNADEADAVLAEAKAKAVALELHPRDGRSVLEAEALPGDKAQALGVLVERTGAKSVVYAGDDLTDLPAIARAARLGLGFFVTSAERPDGPPYASGVFDGTDGVRAWLVELASKLA